MRFIRSDLNFARLPERAYDVIWSSGCLHHIVNLEHLFAEVERALRPGGLFAFRDYVGERRMQFAPRASGAYQRDPARRPAARWRRTNSHQPAAARRAEPVLRRAIGRDRAREARFELVHKGVAGALFPLNVAVDLGALERYAPEIQARLLAAERDALREPTARPCATYAVFRKPG